jgi:hypothetical protein
MPAWELEQEARAIKATDCSRCSYWFAVPVAEVEVTSRSVTRLPATHAA